MTRLKAALLAATLIGAGAGGVAYAQIDTTYDLTQLPAISGKVAQYLPTPRGDVDGFVLQDGTIVHVPPSLSTQVVFAVRPGDSVTVHGLKARAVPLVAAASVTNDATHVTVSWSGPPRMRQGAQVEVQGRVKAPLYGPRGEINGALLEDGSVVHLPPPEAQRLSDMLGAGKTIVARGEGYSGALGKAVAARQIGPDAAHLTEVARPRGSWAERWWHDRMRRGPGGHGPGAAAGRDGPPPSPPGGPDAPPPQ